MDKKIIIQIAFNVFDFTKASYTKDWIEKRMQIFQSYTLQSLKNQDNQNFLVLVVYDENTEEIVFDELSKYKPLPHNVKFVTNADKVIYKAIPDYRHLFLVRLDSDDMYNRTFISQLHKYKPRSGTKALLNQQGFVYDIASKKLGDYYDCSPPFYVLIYDTEEYLKGFRYRLPNGHPDVIMLPHEILKANNFLVTVHSRNTTTVFNNSYYTKKLFSDSKRVKYILYRYFGVRDDING